MSTSVLVEGHSISCTAVLQEMVGVVTCPKLCQIAKEKLLWQFQCSVQEYRSKISKILNFHPIDLKFEEHMYLRSLNSTTIFLEVHIGQKANIGRISKIVNFRPIHLKFEEDLHIWSLNSTTNYC